MDAKTAYKDKSVLITGGLGFIGSNFAHVLTALGAKVSIVDSLVVGAGGNHFNMEGIRDKVEIYEQDVCNISFMKEIVKGKDYIIHCAGQVDHLKSIEDPLSDLENNTKAAVSLLEACRQSNLDALILYTGTRGVYGKVSSQKQPVKETTCPKPIDCNGINKLACDYYFTLYHEIHGLKTIVFRLTNTFGPRQSLRHPGNGFITQFIKRAMQGKAIEIYGSGEQRRDFIYVWDLINAMISATLYEECIGQTYNIGGEVLSIRDIANKICSSLNKPTKHIFVPYPNQASKIEIGDYSANYLRIRKEAHWNIVKGFDKGLTETLLYYRSFLKKYV